MVSAPISALMFILGTGSVLAFVAPEKVDLIGPIPQHLLGNIIRVNDFSTQMDSPIIVDGSPNLSHHEVLNFRGI
jgi:hypothetical protein